MRYAPRATATAVHPHDPITMVAEEVYASLLRLPLRLQLEAIRRVAMQHTDIVAADDLTPVLDAIEDEACDRDTVANGWWPAVVHGAARATEA